jgi:hypothetical protein
MSGGPNGSEKSSRFAIFFAECRAGPGEIQPLGAARLVSRADARKCTGRSGKRQAHYSMSSGRSSPFRDWLAADDDRYTLTMKDPVTPLVAAVLVIAAASFAPARAGGPALEPGSTPPIVVELFTSQGCSSCPRADVVLGELKARQDVLPLSFHVTYWDRLGWPDTFGLEASTARQRAYADLLDNGGLYTPQMVIGGRIDVVGSQRGRVREAIDLLTTRRAPGPPIAIEDDMLRLGGGPADEATIWLFGFDRQHEVRIGRGENRGRTIDYHNVVREVISLGRWSGEAMEIALPLPRLAADGRDGAAVVVQRPNTGEILAASRIDLRAR